MSNERGVQFGDYHSYWDWGLHMVDFPEISPPTVQSLLVEVPGRDGKLNLSKALDGSVHYTSRKCSLTFDCTESMDKWAGIYSDIQNYLHGQEVQLILDSDPSYYYQGLLEVVLPKYGRASAEIEITGELEPYKYELYSSMDEWLWDPLSFEGGYIREYSGIVVNGQTSFSILGNQKPVTPTIIVNSIASSAITVSDGTTTYEMESTGKYKPAGIIITAGTNTLTFSGCGNVSILYVGGSL